MSHVNFTTLPDSALIRQRDLMSVLPFSAATLWRRVRTNEFPQPVRLSDSITAWKWGDVRTWLDAQTKGRKLA